MHYEDTGVYVVELDDDEREALQQIVDETAIAEDVADLIWFLAISAVAGVRRPGSWERQWVQQATGWPWSARRHQAPSDA